jgi:hypothetical protein
VRVLKGVLSRNLSNALIIKRTAKVFSRRKMKENISENRSYRLITPPNPALSLLLIPENQVLPNRDNPINRVGISLLYQFSVELLSRSEYFSGKIDKLREPGPRGELSR